MIFLWSPTFPFKQFKKYDGFLKNKWDPQCRALAYLFLFGTEYSRMELIWHKLCIHYSDIFLLGIFIVYLQLFTAEFVHLKLPSLSQVWFSVVFFFFSQDTYKV